MLVFTMIKAPLKAFVCLALTICGFTSKANLLGADWVSSWKGGEPFRVVPIKSLLRIRSYMGTGWARHKTSLTMIGIIVGSVHLCISPLSTFSYSIFLHCYTCLSMQPQALICSDSHLGWRLQHYKPIESQNILLCLDHPCVYTLSRRPAMLIEMQ